ncbi:MAG: hypothetical protein ACI9WC_003481 [Arenicella sp.]|jgi:hypothetical protein
MKLNMHATTEQLLEIKDGLSNSVAAHVQGCQACQDELAQLHCLTSQMFDAANQQPRPELWSRIIATMQMTGDVQSKQEERNPVAVETILEERSLNSSGAHANVPGELLLANCSGLNNNLSLSKAIYSLAASVLLTGFIGLYIFGQQSPSNHQAALLQANIQELMLNSRGMELALQNVAFQNELLTSSEQSAAERLYWRLTYVDQMIDEDSANRKSNPERIKTLWNERIDALNGLNQIYYQRQQELDDSEI